MKLPKMILFDYGDTLLCEPDRHFERGYATLLELATLNPNGCTVSDIEREVKRFFHDSMQLSRELYFDIGAQRCFRAMLEYLQIEIPLSLDEIESLVWTAATPGAVMPCADVMLDYLHAHGIRAGVISNTCWSESTLTERFNRLLPNAQMEFIMASSEYLYRKPDPMIFEIALRKARLAPDDVWFCGDRIDWDVMGAANAGIFPVWYESDAAVREGVVDASRELDTKIECLHIRHWNQLVESLKTLE